MKKIIPIVLVGILIISGFGTLAININNKDTDFFHLFLPPLVTNI
jgi:hypothetical protein